MTIDVAYKEAPRLVRRRQAVPQALFVIAERIIQLIPQLATIVLISRLFGRSFFGEYALVLTWSATFQLLAHFAITECLSREMAHEASASQQSAAKGRVRLGGAAERCKSISTTLNPRMKRLR